MAMVNTGLGWQADSDYLVYAADTFIGRIEGRYFYKLNDGYCAGVLLKVLSTGWCGPLTISTDPNLMKQYVSDGHIQSYTHTVFYAGRLWYYSTGYWYRTNNYTVGALPYLEIAGEPPDAGIAALQAASVKPYVSPRCKAFLAGLAIGMAEVDRELVGNGL